MEHHRNVPAIVSKADYIFTFSSKAEVATAVWNNLKTGAVIKGIGTKNYGECNGIIYRNRNRQDYLQQTIEMEQGYFELNEEWKNGLG